MTDHFGIDDDSVVELFAKLSNWGRWGAADQKGTLNLLSPSKVKQATTLVEDGVSLSLSRVIDDDPSIDVLDRPLHHMTYSGERFALHPDELPAGMGLQLSRDFLGWTYHGLYMTHLDALSHVFWKGQMYNGFSSAFVTTSEGATIESVEEAADGVVTRGILADVAQYRGVPWLEKTDAIGPDELEATLAAVGVEPQPGDALIVRTGFWGRRTTLGPEPARSGNPGLHAACAPLLKKWDIALLASDVVNEVQPSGFESMKLPIHQICQVGLGLWLIDNCDLEALSRECLARSRHEFFFTFSPLRVKNGTGSPINPLAVF